MVAPTGDCRPRWAVLLGLRDGRRPGRFFEAAAFEPYNQHFVQDIGAFQIGLGAVLLLSAFLAGADGLTAGLPGVAVGSAAHVISHVVGRDLGGTPEVDIPVFAVMTLLLLAGGLDCSRRLPGSIGGETGDPRRYRWPSASRRQAGEAVDQPTIRRTASLRVGDESFEV